jgi:hypothetical protein
MKLEKILVILIIIRLFIGLYLDINYFHIPYWLENGDAPKRQELASFLRRLFGYTSTIFAIIGVIQLIQLKKLKIVKAFSPSIYLFVTEVLLYYVVCIFSVKMSIFSTGFENVPWFDVPLRFFNFFLLLFVFYYYLFVNKTSLQNKITKPVSQLSRFMNRLIDLIIVFSITFTNMGMIAHSETIFARDSFFNSNPYWIFALNLFIYYFVLELLFLQTIGKLHNNSFVTFERKRFNSILIRTFGRFIPLDSFSFFGEKGWHDGISETSVVAVQEVNATD